MRFFPVVMLVVCTLAPFAEAKVVRHTRHVDCGSRSSTACSDVIVAALGHGPGLKLKADTPTETVHGGVSIAFCDDRQLGTDTLIFQDGRREVATAANIGSWLAEQGHQVVSITGSTVKCASIITVDIYEQNDVSPGRRRRPATMPTNASLRQRLDNLVLP